MKEADFSKNLFDLVSEHPEIKDIMSKLGFTAINKPGMLQTAGRYMKRYLWKKSFNLLKIKVFL